jgi:N-acetylneuraminic acid mutarotase
VYETIDCYHDTREEKLQVEADEQENETQGKLQIENTQQEDKQLSAGAIGGIVAAGVVVLGVAIFIGIKVFSKKDPINPDGYSAM